MKILFFFIAIASFYFGSMTMLTALTPMHEIFAILIILNGVLAMGFAAIIEALSRMQKQFRESRPKPAPTQAEVKPYPISFRDI